MEYKVIRTEKADELIHAIILYVAEQFGNDAALKKLDEMENAIMSLGANPDLGVRPKYGILRRQGYFVLITTKDLVFYKVYEVEKKVIVYAVVDQRQDYLNIIQGL